MRAAYLGELGRGAVAEANEGTPEFGLVADHLERTPLGKVARQHLLGDGDLARSVLQHRTAKNMGVDQSSDKMNAS